MTDQTNISADASRLDIDLTAPSAVPLSVNIVVTPSGSTVSPLGVVADFPPTTTVHVYGAGGTTTTSHKPQRAHRAVPPSMSDLDMLTWVTGRSIRNKELRVPFSDED